MGQGLLVALEGVAGRDQAAQLRRSRPGRWPVRSCGAPARRPRVASRCRRRRRRPGSARGATAGRGRPTPCRACPPGPPCPGGGRRDSASVREAALPTQSKTTSAPSVSRPASTSDPAWRRTARASWSGGTTWSAPSEAASSRWRACLAPDDDGARHRRADERVEGGDGGEAEGAGAHDGDEVTVGDAGRQRGVDRAGGGLDHDGVLVGQAPRARRGAGWRGPSAARSTTRRRCRCRTRSAAPARGRRRPGCRTVRCGPSRTGGRGGGCARGAQPEHRLDDGPGARGRARGRRSRCRPSSSTPTTSWPGTKGKLTRSSK